MAFGELKLVCPPPRNWLYNCILAYFYSPLLLFFVFFEILNQVQDDMNFVIAGLTRNRIISTAMRFFGTKLRLRLNVPTSYCPNDFFIITYLFLVFNISKKPLNIIQRFFVVLFKERNFIY